ncbi:unnamed protein product, partial [Adineta steineri]
KTLIERHTTQPSFLTERDFKDGTLECKKVTNKPAVYAVTICIPDWLYASMKADPKLCNLQVLKTASFDGMGSVHLRGKIGETNGFQQRVRKYNSNDESSGLGPVFCYLRKEAKVSKAEFTDWVKVWPILSGECLQDTEERIKMETRCSFLLGRDAATRFQNDSPEAIAAIDNFVKRMNLKKKSGYVKPKTSQYGWRATCPECKEVYCVTKVDKKPDHLVSTSVQERKETCKRTDHLGKSRQSCNKQIYKAVTIMLCFFYNYFSRRINT